MENAPVLSKESQRFLPYLVAAAFFMQLLDATILNTALPAIARSFHCDPLQLHSVVIAYLLTVAVLIPSSGWVSDKLGSRRTFLLAISLFSLGSLLCAFSLSVNMLVFCRVIQGIGGAFLMPVGRLVILRAYPRTKFVQVMNLVTIPGLIGPLAGPLLGGVLVEYASWEWIFLINVPVGLLGIWGAVKWMPNLFAVQKSRFDIPGFLLFATAALCFSLSLEGMQGKADSSLLSAVLGTAGGICLIAYWFHAKRVPDSLFSLRLFDTKCFTTGIWGNLVSRLGGSAMPYLMPLFFQVVLGFSAFKSGLSLLPLAACGILAKFAVNPLLYRFGYRRVMVVNTVTIGLLMCGFFLIAPGVPEWILALLLGVLGGVNSLQFTCMNTLTLIDLPQKEASGGNSLLSVIMQLSISLSIALASLVLGWLGGDSVRSSPGEIEAAFHGTFIVVGLVSMMSSLVFARVPADKGKRINGKVVL